MSSDVDAVIAALRVVVHEAETRANLTCVPHQPDHQYDICPTGWRNFDPCVISEAQMLYRTDHDVARNRH
jgi:hypothetical protein